MWETQHSMSCLATPSHRNKTWSSVILPGYPYSVWYRWFGFDQKLFWCNLLNSDLDTDYFHLFLVTLDPDLLFLRPVIQYSLAIVIRHVNENNASTECPIYINSSYVKNLTTIRLLELQQMGPLETPVICINFKKDSR